MKPGELSNLFLKFCEGDLAAFEALYFHFFPAFIKYGRSLGFSKTASEDQVQNLFIWLWKNRSRLAGTEQIDAYLYTAFRNNLLSQKRKSNRRRQIIQLLEQAEEAYIPAAPALGPTGRSEILLKLLNELPNKQREVIFLRYYEEKSIEQIAQIMSISPQIVRNYAYRAISKLRRHAHQLKHILQPLILMYFIA